MAEKDMFPLNQNLMRGLNDKMYEKRKIAALEIERWVSTFISPDLQNKNRIVYKARAQDFFQTCFVLICSFEW